MYRIFQRLAATRAAATDQQGDHNGRPRIAIIYC